MTFLGNLYLTRIIKLVSFFGTKSVWINPLFGQTKDKTI